MAEGHTEQDERLIAEALHSRGDVTWSTAIQDAHNVLDALAGAGRLLPDDTRSLRRALELIGTDCANYTGGWTCTGDPGRRPDAKYTAERWCDQCIARTGLAGGDLPGVGPWVPAPGPEGAAEPADSERLRRSDPGPGEPCGCRTPAEHIAVVDGFTAVPEEER